MIIFCGWCHEKQGEKEPLDVRTITHTMCWECEEKMNVQDIAQEQKKSDREAASDDRYDEEVREGGL